MLSFIIINTISLQQWLAVKTSKLASSAAYNCSNSSVSSSSVYPTCSLHLLLLHVFPFSSSSHRRTHNQQNKPPAHLFVSEKRNFIIITVIAAIMLVVFTSLPPAESRTSNSPKVHYSSHSIMCPSVNHAVDHT